MKTTKIVSVSITPEAHERLKAFANNKGISVSAAICEMAMALSPCMPAQVPTLPGQVCFDDAVIASA